MRNTLLLISALIFTFFSPMGNTAIAASCGIVVNINSLDATCGNNDGSSASTITGGTAPYQYHWTSGDTIANADSLKAGVYVLTVTDSTGCQETAVAVISNGDGPSLTVDALVSVSCAGAGDGSASLSTSGGTAPYQYSWSSGDTLEDLTGLLAGPYELVLEDADGCIAAVSISIGTPLPIALTSNSTAATCGNSDGSASILAGGGTGPYTYNWSSGGTDTLVSNLGGGIYGIEVSDANGCTDSIAVAITETGGASIVIDSSKSVSCGKSLGSAFITASGGVSPLTYAWSDGSSNEDLTNVQAGNYSLTVTGADSCIAYGVVKIGVVRWSKPAICIVTVDSITDRNICVFEKDSMFNAGVDYYNFYKGTTKSSVFHWIGSGPSTSLSAWTDWGSNTSQKSWKYKVAAVDTCGVESWWSDLHNSMHLTIKKRTATEYDLIWNHYVGFTYPSYIIKRYHASTGWIAIDTISSSLNSYMDIVALQGEITYSIEALHPSGCSATKQKDFNSAKSNTSSTTAPGPMSLTVSSTDVAIANCNGTATATPSGGTLPYTYLWNDSTMQTTAIASGLCPGNYLVIVIDADGNSVQEQVAIGTGNGINQLSNFYGVKAHPNPFNQATSLTFRNSEQEVLHLVIYDITGRLIREYRNVSGNTVDVQREELRAGTYYYHLKGLKGLDVGKLIIN